MAGRRRGRPGPVAGEAAARGWRGRPYLDDLVLGKGLGRARERELGAILADPAATADRRREARNELAAGNTALVVLAMRPYIGRGVEAEDLIGAGNLGLLRAAEKYDISQGCRFGTYAMWWIRRAMSVAILDSGTVRVPGSCRGDLAAWRRARLRLVQAGASRPPAEAVLAEMGVGPRRAERALRAAAASMPLGGGRAVRELPDRLDPPPEAAMRAEAAEAVGRALRRLPARERRILRLYYGMDGPAKTYEEIAAAMGVSRSRVGSLAARAVRTLREKLGERLALALFEEVA